MAIKSIVQVNHIYSLVCSICMYIATRHALIVAVLNTVDQCH